MNVEVVTADAFIGSVVGDLQSRRGQEGEENSENGTAVTAMMPLLHMFDYRNQLRLFTRGSATFSMAFERYDPLPPSPHGDHPPPTAAAALRA